MARTTVDALLDAAEAEFAGTGIDDGSLRRIMREAGADPGSVHYHFGGRAALATAVLDRVLAPLNARRLALLDQALVAGTPAVPQLVEALIRPDVETAHALQLKSHGRARLIGAIYIRPSDFVVTTVAAHFAPVADAFRPHLEAALPHLSFGDIAWRIRWCVFGTVGAILSDDSALFDRAADDLITELAGTLAAALAA
jgi:AcrR family transcriptional regulator